MIDLNIVRYHRATGEPGAQITPLTVKGAVWLSNQIILLVELDKPVTLSLDGALEIESMARSDGLSTEGP